MEGEGLKQRIATSSPEPFGTGVPHHAGCIQVPAGRPPNPPLLTNNRQHSTKPLSWANTIHQAPLGRGNSEKIRDLLRRRSHGSLQRRQVATVCSASSAPAQTMVRSSLQRAGERAGERARSGVSPRARDETEDSTGDAGEIRGSVFHTEDIHQRDESPHTSRKPQRRPRILLKQNQAGGGAAAPSQHHTQPCSGPLPTL